MCTGIVGERVVVPGSNRKTALRQNVELLPNIGLYLALPAYKPHA